MFVIVDLDHTVSDAAWRDQLLGKWDEYYLAGCSDHPVEFVVDLLRTIAMFGEKKFIVAVTGRPEETRTLTLRWLVKHHVPVDLVLMRADGDHRPSPVVKRELVVANFPDLSAVAFVLEDRDDCVAMYKQLGLNVLQVSYACKRGGYRGQTVEDGNGQREEDSE